MKVINKELIKAIKTVAKQFEHGSLFIMGGGVRDFFINVLLNQDKTIKDIDFATPRKFDYIKEVADRNGWKCNLTGQQFLVAKVQVDKNNRFLKEVDIATFRTEVCGGGGHTDCEVQHTSNLEVDVQRRDFGMNGIAIEVNLINNKLRFTVHDHVNGIKQIKNRRIEFIGNASERINDDPLRMLRAIRFASQLGFEIAPATKQAIIDNAHKLNTISYDRVKEELEKILQSNNPAIGIRLMFELNIANQQAIKK